MSVPGIYELDPACVELQIGGVSSCVERRLSVPYRHQVWFTEGTFAPANGVLRDVLVGGAGNRRARVLSVLDAGVCGALPGLIPDMAAWFEAHSDVAESVAEPMMITGGERVKNAYFHVSDIHERIDRHHIDRHAYVLVVGGGALLDMVGLAAATAHRGVRLIRLPSTTLAQADSGVGVKNGINAFGKKNFVGTFAPPFAVINDFAFIRSLPDRDRRAGLAEAVKVALIRDREFFEELEALADRLARFEDEAMRRAIRRSAELHLEHIAGGGDPFEFGSARPLDFGHWSAHKLEPLSDYRIRHGEAVAVGIALDVVYSRRRGLLGEGESERVLSVLRRLGFELYANELHYADSSQSLVLLKGLEEFREHLGGELTVTLLSGLGQGVEVHAMEARHIVEAAAELRERFGEKTGR